MKRVSDFTARFNELVRESTVTQTSDFLGIGKATVSSYMSGARTAKASFLSKIADAYGVEVLWLMGYDVPKYNETPADEGEGLNEDRAYLTNRIKSLSDDEVRILRGIIDQVLSMRNPEQV